jgi:hypothetical protein
VTLNGKDDRWTANSSRWRFAQLDQAETCVFPLVESEPDLIRQPEMLNVLTHLKGAINSLQAVGQRARLQADRERAQGRRQEAPS